MVRPKRLSASALHVADLCLKRYVAMNVNYAGGIQNSAAQTGTTCHYALEKFVDAVFIKKTHTFDKTWLDFWLKQGYTNTFGNSDYTSYEFMDAQKMIDKWFENADFTDREVLSVEKKRYYDLQLNDGSILPLTYIWDREDYIPSTGQYCVVDYKSNQADVGTEELKKKIQARFYALICQILHPDATSIRVEFHLLRHGITTAIFTPQENAETWAWLMQKIDTILDAPMDPQPTLNAECGFCVMKTTCPEVRKNVSNGGVFSMTPEELVDRKAVLDLQAKAAKDASAEIENILGPILAEPDAPDHLDGDKYRATLSVQKVRNVDDDLFEKIIQSSNDPALITAYTPKAKITMGLVDKLLKDKTVDPGIKITVKQLISFINRDPSVNITPK